MTTAVLTWWSLLCLVSLLNVAAWASTVAVLRRRSPSLHMESWGLMKLQMFLSAGYVFGCAYRSVLPVFDIQRLCLIDSWLSSVIVGRSVATIAELCFAAQWALLSRSIAMDTGSRVGAKAAQLVFPMIAVAEIFSWYAVLTTSNLGHVVEESLWGLCALMVSVIFWLALPRTNPGVRPILLTFSATGAAYAFYMFAVDVPMYWTRWTFDLEHGRQFLSLSQGLLDASVRWVVSHQWSDWETEVIWMSLYFSVAVWISIGLIHLPGRLGKGNLLTNSQPTGYMNRHRINSLGANRI
jgi:hypothetical protein